MVSLVFLRVQYGPGDEFTMWFINQGRKYVEASSWASIAILVVLVAFAYNVVGTCVRARRMTGVTWVLWPHAMAKNLAASDIANLAAYISSLKGR